VVQNLNDLHPFRRYTVVTQKVETMHYTVADDFRLAKVEHYLQRAEDFVQMARYHSARKAINMVFSIDPANRAAQSLDKRISILTAEIANLKNGNASPINSSESRKRRNQLVMIVDQDEELVMRLIENLRKYGFHAIGASSYAEALENLSFGKPDLVISEVNFENGSAGFDLFLWFRTHSVTGDVPFLFLATRIDREVLIAGKRLGVDDFILKPLDVEVVTASVINCLAQRKKK
jgi:PleD family two-component response regulator